MRLYWILTLLGILLPLQMSANGFPRTLTLDNGVELQRVGEATFRWTVFRVYDGAFFRQSNMDESGLSAKHLELVYHTDITAERIVAGGDAILRRNVSATEFEALSERLRLLNAAYRNVSRGDRYALTFIPGVGTQLRLNDELLVTIPGDDFAKAYFRIWLGDDPISDAFRDRLLGLR
ncbi:MAG: chalcone isomerase family protein [Verrucomicrobia bacterium]|nr:chalcone isomerase family protein [Verrucomicrobiota bacterium]